MILADSSFNLVVALLVMVCMTLFVVAILAAVLYFVVRNAVLSALRKHDEERMPAQLP